MRIDRYLKVSRLIKRREVAKNLCDAGCVFLNGRPAKPAAEVKVRDLVAITNPSGQRLSFRILKIASSCPANLACELYELETE